MKYLRQYIRRLILQEVSTRPLDPESLSSDARIYWNRWHEGLSEEEHMIDKINRLAWQGEIAQAEALADAIGLIDDKRIELWSIADPTSKEVIKMVHSQEDAQNSEYWWHPHKNDADTDGGFLDEENKTVYISSNTQKLSFYKNDKELKRLWDIQLKKRR